MRGKESEEGGEWYLTGIGPPFLFGVFFVKNLAQKSVNHGDGKRGAHGGHSAGFGAEFVPEWGENVSQNV